MPVSAPLAAHQHPRRAIVSNMTFTLTPAHMADILRETGILNFFDLIVPPSKGEHAELGRLNRGFFFVSFATQEETDEAIARLDGQKCPYSGRTIHAARANLRQHRHHA